MRLVISIAVLSFAGTILSAQESQVVQIEPPPAKLTERPAPPVEGETIIPIGTRVPLVLLNSVSTKHASPDDLVYLESVYPVVVNGRIVIPPGTYVSGRVTSVKRPGRVKGKGELYVRFEQIILPNGIIRDLTGSVGALDGRSPEGFDKEEGKITSEGNKGGDARTVGESTATGAGIGVIAGAAGSNAGLGLGIGSAAGAAAGLIGVLASRGPDAILEKGTQLDMVLDRGLIFKDEDLQFDNPLGAGRIRDAGNGPDPNRNRQGDGGRRFPL
jgi:type IV secretion system protein VirB10